MRLFTFAATVCAFILSTAAVAEYCDEVKVLALNMYHEARDQGINGMIMVGEVTLNRVNHPEYPDTVCEVVYQPGQFSWTTNSDQTPHEEEAWEASLDLAEGLLSGEIEMVDNGATHFLNVDTVSFLPRWARSFEVVGRIGDHTFYKM